MTDRDPPTVVYVGPWSDPEVWLDYYTGETLDRYRIASVVTSRRVADESHSPHVIYYSAPLVEQMAEWIADFLAWEATADALAMPDEIEGYHEHMDRARALLARIREGE